MKVLDKIMARLGYVPKSDLVFHIEIEKSLMYQRNRYEDAIYRACDGNVEYRVCEIPFSYVVESVQKDDGDKSISIPIKLFSFGDDKEYARLCAEELCEKLNETID